MKTSIVSVSVTVLLVLVWSGFASAVETGAPHDAGNDVSCQSCHHRLDKKNKPHAVQKNICRKCHDAVKPVPALGLTAAANCRNGQGNFNDWAADCAACHDPHFTATDPGGEPGGGSGEAPAGCWQTQFGTGADEAAWGMTVDDNGNTYTTGYSRGNLFDANVGGYDLFVVKYDGAGNRVWSVQLGSSADDFGHNIALDGLGSVYVAGTTKGDLDGAGENVHAGGRDSFVAKFTEDGTLLWIKQWGTAGDDFCWGLATDSVGNVVVTGRNFLAKLDDTGREIWSRTDAGQALATGVNDVVLQVYNGRLSMYDAQGRHLWSRTASGRNNGFGYAVAADQAGNVYYTYHGYGPYGGSDIHVAAYDAAGNSLWSDSFGTVQQEYSGSVAVSSDGVYVVAETEGSLAAPNQGQRDVALVKYSPDGSRLWMKQWGGPFHDQALAGLVLDAFGNYYISGQTFGVFMGDFQGGLLDVFLFSSSEACQ